MSGNIFRKPREEYVRDHDIIGNYKRTAIKHLSTKFNKSIADVTTWYESKEQTVLKPVDPVIEVIRRDANRDRYKTKTTLTTYLAWVHKRGLTLAANLVAYENRNVRTSYVAEFVLGNLVKRKATKSLMANYFAVKNEDMGHQMNLLQSNYKLFNNSISGATSSPHNSMYYSSSHTTLTSICRSCTSFANATNEKMLASNRAYFTLDDALANISDIASRFPREETEAVIAKYSIVPPTPEYVAEQCTSCIRLYQRRGLDKVYQSILEVVSGLTEAELIAVSFSGDLFAFKDFNDSMFREFIDGFMQKPTVGAEDPDSIVNNTYEDITILASLLNSEYTKGTSIKVIKQTKPEQYALYAAHSKSISDHLEKYKDFIHTFISLHTVPQNLHSVPNMVRRAVVGSDTDSSIFSVAGLVEWHQDSLEFNILSDQVSAVFAFITSQTTANAMAYLSCQLGVRDDQWERIAMKSEYFFPTMILANNQKHYISLQGSKESAIYAKPKLDVKGVGFKNSRVPTEIMNLTNEWFYELLNSVYTNKLLTPMEIMSVPAFVEHSILDSIKSGSPDLYITAKIKTRAGYAKPESSVWLYSQMWQEVFSNKYGVIEQLPCTGVKVNVTLRNKGEIQAWADTMSPQMKHDLLAFCEKFNKWKFTQIIVPQHAVATGKIPSEILPIVNTNKVLSSMTTQFYMALECFGIFMGNTKDCDWVSDTMTKQDSLDNALIPMELVH